MRNFEHIKTIESDTDILDSWYAESTWKVIEPDLVAHEELTMGYPQVYDGSHDRLVAREITFRLEGPQRRLAWMKVTGEKFLLKSTLPRRRKSLTFTYEHEYLTPRWTVPLVSRFRKQLG